ncbi:MAG: heme A synthase [Xanthobacteraceae bacterium]|nr:MAG: heme A synthase [Xanthobacteraceae bacterium]
MTDARRVAIVRGWLIAVAAMIFAMVVVGGATRLTESGLSIVEWKPVTGVLPPLSEAQWNEAFDGYKTIPQYRELNRGMNLSEFKTIFWWEWAHRLLGRGIGFVYLLPFVWFIARGWIPKPERARLWGIFALGGLQGAVGWWMVASGLTGRTEVSQYRLAIHLTLAVVLFVAVVASAWRLMPAARPQARSEADPRLRLTATLLLVLTVVQIFLGALVAGLRAGRIFNTWPLIDDAFIPQAARLWFESPWWRNLFENTLTVQFDHRMVAYGLWALALWHVYDAVRSRADRAVAGGAATLATLMTVQAGLGIWTLIEQVPIGLALLHQGGALLVVTAATVQRVRLHGVAARSQYRFA